MILMIYSLLGFSRLTFGSEQPINAHVLSADHNNNNFYQMNWCSKDIIFSTAYCDNQASFAIAVRNAIPGKLSKELRSLLSSKKINDDTIFYYTYNKSLEMPAFYNADDNCIDREGYNPDYHVHIPLMQNNKESKRISAEDLCKLMQKKSIAWYTGAGISAAVVPTMASLEQSLGVVDLVKNEKASNFVSTVLMNPEQTALIIRSFFEQCLYGEPTVAHKAITYYMQCNKNCMLFTENLDMLHEHADISLIRINDPISFKNNISEQILKDIDIFICVGLSHDDRGLLGYYKHYNPAGIIIAQCLEQPSYLAEEDYLLQGDAQEVIPKLVMKQS